MAGKKNKKKSKQSSQVPSEPIQVNSQVLTQLTTEFQDYLKYFQQQVSQMPLTTNLINQLKEIEVPMKFKINSEDLEVKVEDLKNIEVKPN